MQPFIDRHIDGLKFRVHGLTSLEIVELKLGGYLELGVDLKT
jgi:hypothetical protein